MSEDLAIYVQNVSKDFVLPHEKVNSIKGLFTGMAKGHNKGKEIQHALKDISFEIKKGEFFGIVGRNGSGKSTLLKILAGIYQPTRGTVVTRGKLVPFIELGVGFNPELTGRENVYLNGAMLGFSQKEVEAMYSGIVKFAELERFMDQKLKNFSSGMQVRLAFSMATRAEADILLVDEILAVGDADFQRKCFAYFRVLKKHKKTVIFVSHDMAAIREYCDQAVLIEESEIIAAGTASKVASDYSHLFMQANPELTAESGAAKTKNRWGNGAICYETVTFEPNSLSTQKTLTINTQLKVVKDTDIAVAGFALKDAADTLLLGSNTTLEDKKLTNLKVGEKVYINWSIPNILQDGDYYINVSVENGDTDVLDAWEEAAKVQVRKETKTGFTVQPAFGVDIQRVQKD